MHVPDTGLYCCTYQTNIALLGALMLAMEVRHGQRSHSATAARPNTGIHLPVCDLWPWEVPIMYDAAEKTGIVGNIYFVLR